MLPPELPVTHGVVERHGDHYAATCAGGCGMSKHVPADVGRATAECTLRYAGWKRGKDKRWRCSKCVKIEDVR
jgi:hypothetical protein